MEILNEICCYFEYYPYMENVHMKVDVFGRRDITKEEYETVISEKGLKFRMYLNNDLKFWEDIFIEGPITIEKLLIEIYEFYHMTLKEENIERAFEGYEDLYEEVLEEYEGNKSAIENYDVFTTDPDVTFEGLEMIEEGYYGLLLGPL